jgi:hypothetical protein
VVKKLIEYQIRTGLGGEETDYQTRTGLDGEEN